MSCIMIASFLVTPVSSVLVEEANAQPTDDVVNRYIQECYLGAQNLANNLDNPFTTEDMINQMEQLLSNCDNNILFYAQECLQDPSRIYCNSSMSDYLQLRGLDAPAP